MKKEKLLTCQGQGKLSTLMAADRCSLNITAGGRLGSCIVNSTSDIGEDVVLQVMLMGKEDGDGG